MRIKRAILVAALTFATGAAATSPVAAATPRAQDRPAGVADTASTTTSAARLANGAQVNSAAAAKQVQDYWTPERMRQAKPVPAPDPGALTGLPAGAPTGKAGSTPAAAGKAGMAAVTESAVVGKVFFHNPSGGDFVCSASALNSASKQLVVTAGHCVHQGGGGTWMQNWTFVPRYRNGARPFGTFAAKQFRAFNAWIDSSDLRRDVAMVTTWPLNGQKVVNVVGGHGLNWNWPRNVAVTVLGYPGNRDGGQIQWWCQGTTRGLSDGRIEIQCDFGGGASGGPWLMDFNDSTGLGQVDGVTSTIASGGWNRSSYFDDGVKGMFDAQGSVT